MALVREDDGAAVGEVPPQVGEVRERILRVGGRRAPFAIVEVRGRVSMFAVGLVPAPTHVCWMLGGTRGS